MYKKTIKFIVISALFAIVFVPHHALAAQLSFVPVPSPAGDASTTIDVRIDPQGQLLNVVQGTLNFHPPAGATLSVEVMNGNSVLTIWPTFPVFSSKTNSIDFAGGVPGGFSKTGLLFEMHVTSSLSGPLNISMSNAAAYLNDGKGTQVAVTAPSSVTGSTQSSSATAINVPAPSETTKNSHNKWRGYGIIIVIIICAVLAYYGIRKFIKK